MDSGEGAATQGLGRNLGHLPQVPSHEAQAANRAVHLIPSLMVVLPKLASSLQTRLGPTSIDLHPGGPIPATLDCPPADALWVELTDSYDFRSHVGLDPQAIRLALAALSDNGPQDSVQAPLSPMERAFGRYLVAVCLHATNQAIGGVPITLAPFGQDIDSDHGYDDQDQHQNQKIRPDLHGAVHFRLVICLPHGRALARWRVPTHRLITPLRRHTVGGVRPCDGGVPQWPPPPPPLARALPRREAYAALRAQRATLAVTIAEARLPRQVVAQMETGDIIIVDPVWSNGQIRPQDQLVRLNHPPTGSPLHIQRNGLTCGLIADKECRRISLLAASSNEKDQPSPGRGREGEEEPMNQKTDTFEAVKAIEECEEIKSPKPYPSPPLGAKLFEGIEVPIQVVLGHCTLSAIQLLELSAGSILTMDRGPEGVVEVYCGQHLLGRGTLMEIEGRLGVRLVEVEVEGEPGRRPVPDVR